jgi:hypothetical protein
MPPELVGTHTVDWIRLKNDSGEPYKWGDRKIKFVDPNWSKSNVIYRWIKNSTNDIAIVGETDSILSERVNDYISAKFGGSAGFINKKAFVEQLKLQKNGDFLTLEFTKNISGFDLSNKNERKIAEGLLIAHYKPYLLI